MRKSCLKMMFVVLATATLNVSAALTNLYDAVTADGQKLAVSATRLNANANAAFNGVTYADLSGGADPNERVLLYAPKDGVNPSLTVKLPEGWATDRRVVLRKVRIYPVTYYSNTRGRMPTEYVVYGVDLQGAEHELLHPVGLEYPTLDNGNAAPKGTYFDVDVSDAEADRVDCRQFRIEFLNSEFFASGSSTIAISMMEVEYHVELQETFPYVTYAPQSLSQMMRDAGYTFPLDQRPAYVLDQNSWDSNSPQRAFDGITRRPVDATGDSHRWLGKMGKSGGTWLQLTCPDDVSAGDDLLPVAGRVWCANYNGNELARAPTAFTLYGLDPASAAAPTAIFATNGWNWTGVDHTKAGQNTLGVFPIPTVATSADWRTFRFQPTASAMAPTGTEGTELNVDLAEVEIFVQPVPPKGQLRVAVELDASSSDGFSHALGSLVAAAATVTAPEMVEKDGALYAVTGYRLETFDETVRAWTTTEIGAARSYAYVPDATKRRRLVWLVDSTSEYVKLDIPLTGRETVTCSPAPLVMVGRNFYLKGTEVTLTAHPCADDLTQAGGSTNLFHSAFVRWEGDTNGLTGVTAPQITFTLDGPCTLTPCFRRDWLLYRYDYVNEGGSGTEWRIKNGIFDLCVDVENDDFGHLGLMYSRWFRSGSGELDLDTDIIHHQTGAAAALTRLCAFQLSKSHEYPRADFSRIVLPRTLEEMNGSGFRDQTNLTEVVIDCPRLVKITGPWFTRDLNLRRVTFKVPNVRTIEQDYLFYKCPMDETDASAWRLDSLTEFIASVNYQFSAGECGRGHGFAGTLTLPCITNLPSHCFNTQDRVTNFVFGSKTAAVSVIGGQAFEYDGALESLTLGCTTNLTVEVTAFRYCTALRTVTLLKHVPPRLALDRILAARSATDRATLYVSGEWASRAWTGFVQPIDPAADPNAPAEAVGVYVTTEGLHKAWIVYRPSPLDPKGLLIFLR